MSSAAEILAVLGALREKTTMCPGELARRLGTSQQALRATLAGLAERGEVTITQRGVTADLRTLHGPYRVRASDSQGAR